MNTSTNNKNTSTNNKNTSTNNTTTNSLLSKKVNNVKEYTKSNYKIILFIVLLILVIIGTYFLIKWYKSNKTEYVGYSYYPKDLDKINNKLFTLNTISFEDCKQTCIRTPSCRGITLKPSDEKCYGFGDGSILRDESDKEMRSWVKPEDSIFQAKSELLLTMTDLPFVIDKAALLQPFMLGKYNYNFYLYIEEFKSDNWKHVFHKGSVFENLKTNDWDNIVKTVPEQFIGVWIAPYNTHLRIATTTKSGTIEYIDIANIPINKLTFVSVNLVDNAIEVYLDTKLVETHVLNNSALYNSGDIYVKYNNSFNGSIYYLTYTPEYLNHIGIVDLYNKSIYEITNEMMKKYGYK